METEQQPAVPGAAPPPPPPPAPPPPPPPPLARARPPRAAPPPPASGPPGGGFDAFAPGGSVLPKRRRRWGTVAALVVAGLVVGAALVMLVLARQSGDRAASPPSRAPSPAATASGTQLGPLELTAWVSAATSVNTDLTQAVAGDDLVDAEGRLSRLHEEARRLQEATDTVTDASSPGLRSRLEAAGLDLLERAANLLSAARAAARREPHRGLLAKAAAARVRFETELAELRAVATSAPATPVTPASGSATPTPAPTTASGSPVEGDRAAAEAYIRATVGNTTAAVVWDVAGIEPDLKVSLESATGRKCLTFVDGQGGCGLVYQTPDVGVPFIVVWTGATWQFYALAD